MSEVIKPRCGRASGRKIAPQVGQRLIAAAAGWCERPTCPTGSLWHELANGEAVKIAQVAHIIAASPTGPRGDAEVPVEKLIAFDNLILLCPNCHSLVDKAPTEHPVELLRRWKTEHESRLREILSVPAATTRSQARAQLNKMLAENRAVFEQYSPGSPASAHPEGATTWLREVQQVILPNNARIAVLFDVNMELLRPEEHRVVAAFQLHRRGMEARHTGLDVGVSAPKFPPEVEDLFND